MKHILVSKLKYDGSNTHSSLSGWGIIAGLVFCNFVSVLAPMVQGQEVTQVALQIRSTYSGTASLATGMMYFSGGTYYYGDYDIPVVVSATAVANVEFSGDAIPGQSIAIPVVGVPTNAIVTATTGEGMKFFDPLFRRGTEPYFSTGLSVFVDVTPPLSVIRNTIVDGSTVNNSVLSFDWTNSVDTGVGLSGYQLVFSYDPSFSAPFLVYQSSQNSVSLSGSFFSNGMVFWSVQAIDYVGNASSPSIGHFTYLSGVLGGGSGGGGRRLLTKDNCLVDYSPSYYDNDCGLPPPVSVVTPPPTSTPTSPSTGVNTIPAPDSSGKVTTIPNTNTQLSPVPDQSGEQSVSPSVEDLERLLVVEEGAKEVIVITEDGDDISIQVRQWGGVDDLIWGEDLFICDPLLYDCDREYTGGGISVWLGEIYDDVYVVEQRNKNILFFYVMWLKEYHKTLPANVIVRKPKEKVSKKLTKIDFMI